jgi:uncharacterized delta-60 repeat protein
MLAHRRRFISIAQAAIFVAAASLLLLLCAQPSSALSSPFDTHFGSNESVQLTGYDANIQKRDQIAVAPNGSFAVVGSAAEFARKSFDGKFRDYGARWAISMYTKNGKPDSRFGKNGKVVLHLPGEQATYPRASLATSARFDRRGRLLVAGAIDHASNADFEEASSHENMQLGFGDVQENYLGLIRLTKRGKLDQSFGKHGVTQVYLYGTGNGYGPAYARAVGIGELPSGRIIVGGTKTEDSSLWSTAVYAFSPNGRRVLDFGLNGKKTVPNATTLRVGPGGHIFAGGIKFKGPNAADLDQSWSVTKLKSNGHFDKRYGNNGVAEIKTNVNTGTDSIVPLVETKSIDIAPIGKGRVLVTGALPQGPKGYSVLTVAQLSPGGKQDKSFGSSGFARAPLGTNTSSSGSSVVMNRFGEIFAGGTINTLPFNTPWEVGASPFPQGVIVQFNERGKPARGWANNAVQSLTKAGVKACPYGPQLSIQAKRVLATGCWRELEETPAGEVFRINL